jgi:putative oxidoreductase
MNPLLWIPQVVLAVVFLLAGSMKLVRPIDALATSLPFVRSVPPEVVRFIGAAELAGAMGLIVPASTGILPWLSPLAAVGLALVMVLAAGLHLARREYPHVPVPVLLLVLAVVVAHGRWQIVPF